MNKSERFGKKVDAFEEYVKMMDKALADGKITQDQHDRFIEKKARQFDL